MIFSEISEKEWVKSRYPR